jgi:hypothetical protein
MEADGQCNIPDGSSGQPGALIEISYFTSELQYVIFYIILGLEKITQIARIIRTIQYVDM